jgi:hypothetical protein
MDKGAVAPEWNPHIVDDRHFTAYERQGYTMGMDPAYGNPIQEELDDNSGPTGPPGPEENEGRHLDLD